MPVETAVSDACVEQACAVEVVSLLVVSNRAVGMPGDVPGGVPVVRRLRGPSLAPASEWVSRTGLRRGWREGQLPGAAAETDCSGQGSS